MKVDLKKEFNIDEDAEALLGFFKEAETAKSKKDFYNDSFKDIKKTAIDQTGIGIKKFNKLFTMYCLSNRNEVEDETDELVNMYDSLMKVKQKKVTNDTN